MLCLFFFFIINVTLDEMLIRNWTRIVKKSMPIKGIKERCLFALVVSFDNNTYLKTLDIQLLQLINCILSIDLSRYQNPACFKFLVSNL